MNSFEKVQDDYDGFDDEGDSESNYDFEDK